MATQNIAKNRIFYVCNICLYNTSNKYDYEKHINTLKHKNKVLSTNATDLATILSHKSQHDDFICFNCNKHYKDKSGLWRHKKKCTIEEKETENVKPICTNDKDELIDYLMKENKEIKELILEIVKKDTSTTNNTTNNDANTNTHCHNNNSYNKAFNLNFFLNETCKDAMNITDFIDSIQLQLSDLESVGEKGYIEGISNIIIKNLKGLDVSQRPLHCTDKKRETIYVKDENIWEKDEAKKKMHKLVRKVQDKNFKMIQKFKEKYPDYNKASSRHSDTYNNIIIESMGGRGDNDFEKEEKIIHKVSKEVVVEK